MGNENSVKVVKILATKDVNKGFKFHGTAFFIDSNTLVTAKHVIREAHKYGDIYINELPEGGEIEIPFDSIIKCDKDIVYFKIKKIFKQIDRVLFSSTNLESGVNVTIIGFDGNKESGIYKNSVIKTTNKDNIIELQNHLTNGLSGSPLLYSGRVYGIAYTVNRTDNRTSIMPISELCLNAEDSEKYYREEKKSKLPWTRDQMMDMGGYIIGFLGLILGVIKLLNPTSTSTPIPTPPIPTPKISTPTLKNIPLCNKFEIKKIAVKGDGKFQKFIVYYGAKKIFFDDNVKANSLIKYTLDNNVEICSIPEEKSSFQYILAHNKVVRKIMLDKELKKFNNKQLEIKLKDGRWILFSESKKLFDFEYEKYASKAKEIILDNNLSRIYFLENFTYLM